MASSKKLIRGPDGADSSLAFRLFLGGLIGLVAGVTFGSLLIGTVSGGVATAFLFWDSRSLIIKGQSEALRRLEDLADITVDADEIGTRVTVPLHREVPTLHSIDAGRGSLTGDVEFDDAICLRCDDARWIGLLLDDVRATLLRLIPALRYDRGSHAFIVSARDEAGHAVLAGHVEQTQALARRLRALSRRSAVARLRERMQEARGAARLPVFKAVWRADQRSARLLARELTDPEIRYFVATATTPPNRRVIEEVALDETILSDLRAEALLRWMGLHAGLRGEAVVDAFDALRARPDGAPHAELLSTALKAWVSCAPYSGKALRLLGKYGDGRHLAVISAQQNGPLAEAVQDALADLRARFEGMGSGHLALTDAGGQLMLTPTGDAAADLEPATKPRR